MSRKPTNGNQSMSENPEDLCPSQGEVRLFGSHPGRPAIHMATVYRCDSPDDADTKLAGQLPGYVYQRDGHPNADLLAEKCRRLHLADRAVVTSSGMSATALAMVATLSMGDHVLLSDRLYGRTTTLVKTELERFGVTHSLVNMSDLAAVAAAITSKTRMLVVETISNPMLHVVDLRQLADIAHAQNAILMVDNTFASPIVCRPLELGADLVVESMTKIMNGHGDVTMGLLCGRENVWERVPASLASWGMTTSPTACWLVERGLATLFLRSEKASQNAMVVAQALQSHNALERVIYPGLTPNQATSDWSQPRSAEPTLYGSILTLKLNPERSTAQSFIKAAHQIPFYPSLGDMHTMLSHPATTSHRSLSEEQRLRLGITPNTIRISIGLESSEYIIASIREALST